MTERHEQHMHALVFDGRVARRTVPVPKPGPQEALVKVALAGICRTDHEICRGYLDFRGVLGHEFVGTVAECPDSAWIGRRVVGEINAGCTECEWCRRGLARHCSNRTVLGITGRGGAFAEYLTLPVENLVPVPDELPDEKAVFTEPVAAALEVLEQVPIKPAQRVLVIGDGKLGLLISLVLRLTGCDLTLAGKHPEKTSIFRSLDGRIQTPEQTGSKGKRFDVVVEASGSPSGWDLALRCLKPRGTLVLKSTYHQAMSFNPAGLVIEEITVVGSRCGPFPPALRLMAAGLVDPTPLISEVFAFDDAEEAFTRSAEPGALKVLVRM